MTSCILREGARISDAGVEILVLNWKLGLEEGLGLGLETRTGEILVLKWKLISVPCPS